MYFLIYFSYDGSLYSGFCKQKNRNNTICEVLENSLYKIFKEFKLKFFSRTDKYVHALEQIVLLKTDKEFDCDLLKKIINKNIEKKSIHIHKIVIRKEPLYFKNIKSRTYIFKFKRNLSVFDNFYFTKFPNIDLVFLKETFKIFLGEHNFRFFGKSSLHEEKKTIYSITVKELNENEIHFQIEGSGFLRYMIRRIFATAFVIKNKDDKLKLSKCLIEGKNIYNLFDIKKVLPHGLYLKKINIYE